MKMGLNHGFAKLDVLLAAAEVVATAGVTEV